jgi:hypothetical protein
MKSRKALSVRRRTAACARGLKPMRQPHKTKVFCFFFSKKKYFLP